MNHSIYTADRLTHLKIVVVALVAATVVAGVGITARVANFDPATATASVKAGQPVMITQSGKTAIR